MSEDSTKNEDSDKSEEEEVVKEEVSLQFHLYLSIFLIIYYGSWLVPGFIFFGYVLYVLLPNFLETANFFSLFTELEPLLSFLGMPLIIIAGYLVRLIIIGIITRIFWKITEKISPSKDGIIPRNIKSKTANYYHLRSFMYKYGKNVFNKGAFPWLSNWYLKQIDSKVGRGTTIEESVGSDKFIDVGKNCYFGVNSTLASHILTGIFGNINYFKIYIGDNVTFAAMNQVGPGSDIKNDAYLLPLASTNAHSVLKGENNYYFGLPLRKIFRKKTMRWLGITEEDLKKNENPEEYVKKKKKKEEEKEISSDSAIKEEELEEEDDYEEEVLDVNELEHIDIENLTKEDLALDFTTTSAISRVNIKFLAVYLPILWLTGLFICLFWYEITKGWYLYPNHFHINSILYLPIAIILMLYIFILGVLLFCKLLLILVNLIHKPKEGIFIAEIGDTDYEFWMLRTELKKIALWFLRNSPLPWLDVLAFRWFGTKMDFSSHLNDAWCDGEFITFGRKNLIGQGATIMSSMIVGKYLIIKPVIFGDYVLVGGHTTIAPGTIMGSDSVIGAISTTTVNQILKPAWVYFGIPAIKLKENKYAEERRDIIIKREVDDSKKFEVEHDVNIEEDKLKLIKTKEK
ncbi:MAG: acyltransferase [Candidatus Hodarchaeota archaeon]